MTVTIDKPAISPAAVKFLSKEMKMLIDGKWVAAASGKTFPVEDPATRETITNVPAGDKTDIDLAVAGTASAIFYNQGQCCTAGSRLFAHKSIYDKVVDGVVSEAGKLKIGHGLNKEVNLGPLVSKEQHDRVTGFIKSGREEGADVVVGGKAAGDHGYFVEPTVLAKTNRDMRVVREEIFGPLVCIQSFDDDDLEAIAKFANDTEYGLQASIWTQNLKLAHVMARKIKAGTICVNTHNYGDPAWPFGGYKQSGWGREMGKEVMEYYTETKAVAMRL